VLRRALLLLTLLPLAPACAGLADPLHLRKVAPEDTWPAWFAEAASAADQALTDSTQADADQRVALLQRAEEQWRSAADRAKAEQQPVLQAICYEQLTLVAFTRLEMARACSYWEELVDIVRVAGLAVQHEKGAAYLGAGRLLIGDFIGAREAIIEALDLCRSTPGLEDDTPYLLLGLAFLSSALQDYDTALDWLAKLKESGLEAYFPGAEQEDKRSMLAALGHFIECLSMAGLGEADQALRLFPSFLPGEGSFTDLLAQAVGVQWPEIALLRVYNLRGDARGVVSVGPRVLAAIGGASEKAPVRVPILLNVAGACLMLGEAQEAARWCHQAIGVCEDPTGGGRALTEGLSMVEGLEAIHKDAVASGTESGDAWRGEQWLNAQALLVEIRLATGEAEKAVDAAQQLASMGESAYGESDARMYWFHRLLADAYVGSGDSARAVECARQMVDDVTRTGVPMGVGDATGRAALVCHMAGRRDIAAQLYPRALDVLDEARGTLGDPSQDMAIAQLAAPTDVYYRDYVELLIEEGQPDKALSVDERRRAQGLRRALFGRAIALAGDRETAIVREYERITSMRAKAEAQMRQAANTGDTSSLGAVRAQCDGLSVDWDALVGRARQEAPELSAILFPRSADAAAMSRLLDADTVAFSYVLSESGVNLLVSTRDKPVRAYQLSVTGQQVFDLLFKPEGDAAFCYNQDPRVFGNACAELWDALVAPAVAELEGKTRLIVLPDGPLCYVPFAALVDEQERPLVERVSVVMLQSLRTLELLWKHRLLRAAQAGDSSQIALAAIGVSDYPGGTPADTRGVTRSIAGKWSTHRSVPPTAWQSIPRGAQEAELVAKLLSCPEGLRVNQAASEPEVRGLCQSARVLHFSCHGYCNSVNPLDSGLVLYIEGLSDAERENRLTDGYLTAADFMGMKLSADQVVLTACETAVGWQSGGEGVFGLTRALMFAGAPTVVCTLWKADDEASNALSAAYYGNVLAGMDKAEALRQAQLAVRQEPGLAEPALWAPFVIWGDWGGPVPEGVVSGPEPDAASRAAELIAQADAAIKAERFGDAEPLLREAVRLAPDNDRAHYWLSYVLSCEGKYDEALAEAQEAVRCNPGNGWYHYQLAWTLHTLRRYAEAESAARKAVELSPGTPEFRLVLGRALFAQGSDKAALAEFRQAVGLDPDNVDALAYSAAACNALGLLDEAYAAAHKGLDLSPSDSWLWDLLAHAAYGLGKWGEAADAWAKVLELDPTFYDTPLLGCDKDKELLEDAREKAGRI